MFWLNAIYSRHHLQTNSSIPTFYYPKNLNGNVVSIYYQMEVQFVDGASFLSPKHIILWHSWCLLEAGKCHA